MEGDEGAPPILRFLPLFRGEIVLVDLEEER